MATAVGAYEVEIVTGPSVEEGERAKLNLFGEQGGDRIGYLLLRRTSAPSERLRR